MALQDLGAAGLTSAASEMAAKGRVGLDIDLDLVPLREALAPAEILVSESQERMLAVVEPGRVDEVVAACRRWDLDATAIGTVTEGENLVARSGGEVVVDLPARLLADEAPVYGVPRTPAPRPEPLDLARSPSRPTSRGAWLACSPARTSRASAGSTSATTTWWAPTRSAGPAATPRWCGCPDRTGRSRSPPTAPSAHCEPTRAAGGRASVLEAARNLACVGARPIAATDCLNFPNPEKGSTGWRLAEAIAGMSDALPALGVPVVSGNVSLYNERATPGDPADAGGRDDGSAGARRRQRRARVRRDGRCHPAGRR